MEVLSPVTDFDQHIYNTYLRVSRSADNKPFKLRKDFSKFTEDKNYVFVKRLASFFGRHDNISVEEFFQAPHKLYPDEKGYYDLSYYTSPRAIKTYTLWKEQKQNAAVDSSEQIQDIKQSLGFIYDFCKQKKIKVSSYIDYKDPAGVNFEFLVHLSEHRINVYSLFGFPNFEKNIRQSGADMVIFLLGDKFYNQLSLFKMNFLTSQRAKQVVEEGLKLLEKK